MCSCCPWAGRCFRTFCHMWKTTRMELRVWFLCRIQADQRTKTSLYRESFIWVYIIHKGCIFIHFHIGYPYAYLCWYRRVVTGVVYNSKLLRLVLAVRSLASESLLPHIHHNLTHTRTILNNTVSWPVIYVYFLFVKLFNFKCSLLRVSEFEYGIKTSNRNCQRSQLTFGHNHVVLSPSCGEYLKEQ